MGSERQRESLTKDAGLERPNCERRKGKGSVILARPLVSWQDLKIRVNIGNRVLGFSLLTSFDRVRIHAKWQNDMGLEWTGLIWH